MLIFVTNVSGYDSECTQVAALRRNPFGQVSPTTRFIPKQVYYFTNGNTRVWYNKTSISIYFWTWLFNVIRLNPNPIKLCFFTRNSFPTFAVWEAATCASSGRHIVTLMPEMKHVQTLNIYGSAEIWCKFYNLNWALIQTQWKSTRS